MKKVLGVVFAAMLVFGFAGQAMAGYAYGDLVQFLYEGTTDTGNEFNTGLGTVKTGSLTSRTITAGQPATDLGNFLTSDWDEMYMGFTTQYSVTTTNPGDPPYKKNTTKSVFMATTTSGVPDVNTSYFTQFSNLSSGLIASGANGQQAKNTPVSYWEYIEMYPSGFNTQGAYSGFNSNDAANGFATLGILDDDMATGADTGSLVIGRYVDMFLWQFNEYDPYTGDTVRGFVDIDGNWADTHVATLRFGVQDDGLGNAQLYTQINPVNPVPVPAAVWLLGSGLVGLFGIRRRRAA